jgi:hypothetical protein
MWSFFCIAFEIAFREFPFATVIDNKEESAMPDIGQRLGFPQSFIDMLRGGLKATPRSEATDLAALEHEWPTLTQSPPPHVPAYGPGTLDRAFLTKTEDRGYFRQWYGEAQYAALWAYLYGLAQVDPRLRRNRGGRGPSDVPGNSVAFFKLYPPRVPTPAPADVEVAHLSRTDAYPATLFPGVRPRTREYAQFLWNRLVAERSVPAKKRREWWRATFALACKLMDDDYSRYLALSASTARFGRAGGGGAGGGEQKDEGGLEEAVLVALGDPWRGFLVDPDSERRKGRPPPYLIRETYAPLPDADEKATPSSRILGRITSVFAPAPTFTM